MARLGDLLELNFGSHGQGGCSFNIEGLDRGLGLIGMIQGLEVRDLGGFRDSVYVGTI